MNGKSIIYFVRVVFGETRSAYIINIYLDFFYFGCCCIEKRFPAMVSFFLLFWRIRWLVETAVIENRNWYQYKEWGRLKKSNVIIFK